MAANQVVAAVSLSISLTDCMYFLNGNCKNGDECRYRHCRAGGEQTKNCHKWPKSCKNVNCPYRHPSILPKQFPPSPPKLKQQQEGVIALFWDIENVSIPRAERPFDIAQRLREELVLKPGLREVGFTCYCDASTISKENQLSLSHANVRIVHIPDRKPGGADRLILLDLDRFVHDRKPPATIALISGDIDFVGKLSDLRYQHGFHVILVHNKPAKEEIKATVNTYYSWDRFTSSNSGASIKTTSRNNSKKNEPQTSTTSATTRKYQCPLCLKNDFNSLEALRMHQTAKQHVIACSECDDFFFTVQSQQQHYNVKHLDVDDAPIESFGHLSVQALPVQEKPGSSVRASVERLRCPQCSANNFTSMSSLRQHQQAKSHLYDCPECDNSYFTLQEQQQHQLEAHIDQMPSKEMITCRFCPPTVTFASMNALRHHILMNGHGYRCPGCGIDTFFTNDDLTEHVTKCNAAQQFLCPTCDELYCNELGLRLHQVAKNHFDRTTVPIISVRPSRTKRK